MEASILDLRYKMKDVLNALSRREQVKILYHGKVKGTIIPAKETAHKKVTEHPLFGIENGKEMSVEEQMNSLRKSRYHDI